MSLIKFEDGSTMSMKELRQRQPMTAVFIQKRRDYDAYMIKRLRAHVKDEDKKGDV